MPEGASEVYATSDGKYLVREGSENAGIEWRKLHRLISERKKFVFEDQQCSGAGTGLSPEASIHDDIGLFKNKPRGDAPDSSYRSYRPGKTKNCSAGRN